jgi:hypothetical protein
LSTCTVRTDAANKGYVDDEIRLVGTKGFTISIDISSMGNTPNTQILAYLEKLLPIRNDPPNDYLNLVAGTRALALCSRTTIRINQNLPQYISLLYDRVTVTDINTTTQEVIKSGIVGQLSTATLIESTVTLTVKEFTVNSTGTGLVWAFTRDVP